MHARARCVRRVVPRVRVTSGLFPRARHIAGVSGPVLHASLAPRARKRSLARPCLPRMRSPSLSPALVPCAVGARRTQRASARARARTPRGPVQARGRENRASAASAAESALQNVENRENREFLKSSKI